MSKELIKRLESAPLWNGSTLHQKAAVALESQARELAELRAALQRPDRAELQAEGKHPAPCAKFCEATAFGIDIRTLKADRDKYKALCDQLGAAFESGSFIKTQMALAAWRAMK